MPTLSEVLTKASWAIRQVLAEETDLTVQAPAPDQLRAIAQELDEYRITRLTPPGHVHGEAPPDFELVVEPTVGLVTQNGVTCRVWVGTLAGVEVACLVARVSVPEGADAHAIDQLLFRSVPPEQIQALGVEQVAVVESPLLLREIDKVAAEVLPHATHRETAADVAVRLIREAREILEDLVGYGTLDKGLQIRIASFLEPWRHAVMEAEVVTLPPGTAPLIARETLLETARQLREDPLGPDRV